MNHRHTRMGLVVLVAALTPGLVLAANKKPMNKMNKQENAEKVLDKVSREADVAVREAGFARVAIFDGQVDQAKKLLEDAKANLAKAKLNAPTLTVSVKEKSDGKTIDSEKVTEHGDLLPIDAALSLSEDYVATPAKTAKVKEANEHLKKGDHPKAIEVLKEADIGVSVSRVLMPLQRTIDEVDGALKLVNAGKYYEANLTLKGIEDGLIVDQVVLYEPTATKTAG